MAVTPLIDGENRSIDARSIVVLIVFFVVSESISSFNCCGAPLTLGNARCVGYLAGVYPLTLLHISTL